MRLRCTETCPLPPAQLGPLAVGIEASPPAARSGGMRPPADCLVLCIYFTLPSDSEPGVGGGA